MASSFLTKEHELTVSMSVKFVTAIITFSSALNRNLEGQKFEDYCKV
jgi:hypothetical protein